MLGGIIGLFIINYKLAILALFLIPIKYLFIKFYSNIRKKSANDVIRSKSSLANWFGGFLDGLKDIRLLNLQQQISNKFRAKATKYIFSNRKFEMVTTYNDTTDRIFIEAFNTLIYIVGALLYLKGEISVGGVFSFITYLVYISGPMSAIMNLRFMISGIVPSINRYYDFLNMQKETSGNLKIDHKCEQHPVIEFQNVSFSYTNNQHSLQIKDCNIKIDRESKVGIWGKNGSGKSTLINLLLRFYEPACGSILLNGIDIAEYDIENYRGNFSVVTQNIFLFEESLEYNIFLDGEPDNSIVMTLNLQELIHEKGFKYQSHIDGTNLSGGQKQKIALARALYLNKPIFIFDEPTSSLDADSQLQFNHILKSHLHNKTVILISHNYETLKNCDIIIQIEQGKIIASGSSQMLNYLNIN